MAIDPSMIAAALSGAGGIIFTKVVDVIAGARKAKRDMTIDERKLITQETTDLRKEMREEINQLRNEILQWRQKSMDLEREVDKWREKSISLELENVRLVNRVSELELELKRLGWDQSKSTTSLTSTDPSVFVNILDHTDKVEDQK